MYNTKSVMFSCVQPEYHVGTVFNRLEHLKLCISSDYWSKLLVRLLKDSPELRILNLYVSVSFFDDSFFGLKAFVWCKS